MRGKHIPGMFQVHNEGRKRLDVLSCKMSVLKCCNCSGLLVAFVVIAVLSVWISRNQQLGGQDASEDVLQYTKELCHRYGSVVRLWDGSHLLVSLSDARDIAVVFNSPSMQAFCFITWQFSDPTFSRQIIDTYVGTFCEKSRVMTKRLDQHSDELPFDILYYTKPCRL
ncbi:hypothetical protein PR048_016959 [Dryococelus australis]|uniref:Uncharacterized protein n=1 Tax=Dryococelus australis TaxID=614101 RepID=A0ABQ9H861_9NEOP|nr:hypothetical protein PR048_016959 [Dryococelus australis]